MATNNSTAVATRERKELTPAQRTKHLLDSRKEEFAAALAGRVDPEAFIRVAYSTLTKSPALLDVSTSSLMMSLLEAASLGLMPNGVMGEAYIVPFGKEAQFIPGYRGLIKLARQSGVVRNIVARPVWRGERFEVEYGLDESLLHQPDLDRATDDPRDITHVYAVAHFQDGGAAQFDVMTRAAVERIRAKSRAKNNGPWVTDWEAMALKTVIRRLFKMLPSSDFDLTRAVEADNREYERPAVERRSSAVELERRLVAIDATSLSGGDSDDDGGDSGGRIPDAVVVPDADDAGAQAEGGDPLADAAAALTALVEDMKPAGGDTTKAQRNRIRETAEAVFDDREPLRAQLIQLADSEDLGKRQAGILIGRLAVLKELSPEPAAAGPTSPRAEVDGADADDLFGEG